MKATVIAATLFVLAATIYPAIRDGQRRFRWGEDQEVTDLAARLEQFPKTIGQWETVSDHELQKSVSDMLEPFAAINRVYYNRNRQASVNVFLLFGPTGPTAVHTPDICFNSREYMINGDRRSVRVGSGTQGSSRCFVSEFESRTADKRCLKTWYAWTRDGTWQVPTSPRYFFANGRYLFKVQVAAQFADQREMKDDIIYQEFVADLERELRNKVF